MIDLADEYGHSSDAESKAALEMRKPVLRDLSYFLSLENSNEEALLKYRFLCRKGTLMINAPTGIGKSVLTMQSAILWAINQPSLGIVPARPLNSLIVQGENDDYDLKEIISGTLQASGLSPEEQDMAIHSIKVITEKRATGQDLMTFIRIAQKEFKADLLWIDPLFQYIGGNVSDQQTVSNFLRNQLSPLLEELNIGCIILHHTNKPPSGRENGSWKNSEFSYAGSGSMELANFPRAVLSISVTGDPKRFLLRAPKRGRKIGWSDDHGNKVTEIPIKHTDGAFPYWEKEIPRFRDPAQVSESNLSLKGEDLLTILPSGGLRTNEWRDKVVEKYGTSPSTFKRRFKELRDSERIQFDEESNCWKKNKKD